MQQKEETGGLVDLLWSKHASVARNVNKYTAYLTNGIWMNVRCLPCLPPWKSDKLPKLCRLKIYPSFLTETVLVIASIIYFFLFNCYYFVISILAHKYFPRYFLWHRSFSGHYIPFDDRFYFNSVSIYSKRNKLACRFQKSIDWARPMCLKTIWRSI